MSEVYNPYHFVPVSTRTAGQKKHDLDRSALGKGDCDGTTHERYVAGTHSGRIICRVTTKTPLVAGGKQERKDGGFAQVEPYFELCRDGSKRPAIPGSALRGMVSSLAEAASNSALRVLIDEPYSYRKPFDPKHTLSAIGMIILGKDGKLRLRPLALPTLERAGDGRDFAVPPKFREIFPTPLFKVYFGQKSEIRKVNFSASSESPLHVTRYPVRQAAYNSRGGIDDQNYFNCKDRGRLPKQFLVSQFAEGNVPEREGFLRVLGCWGDREKHIPEGKKHELWLPAADEKAPLVEIDPKAIDRFHALADERTEASLKADDPVMPFHPLPTKRNEDGAEYGQRFRLKHGDMVYFDVEKRVVTEISLSAIWRGQVVTGDGKAAGARAFFGSVDPDLLPFHKDRKSITIAERMFGFVEDLDPERKKDERKDEKRQALGLASRIRFSDGILADGITRDQALEPHEVPLRILASPKPPSPAMYFRPKDAPQWVAKVDLKPGKHIPNGRKMYLHHRVAEGQQPWRTKHERESVNQKNKVRPVRQGQVFWFHVDFDNLNDAELGLLLYSLKPAAGFHHKLGMGKPLGLGSIEVEVMGLLEVNRTRRYSLEGLRSGRFAEAVLGAGSGGAAWPERYRRDVSGAVESGDILKLRDGVIGSLVSAKVHQAICLIGNFSKAPDTTKVHTPTLADQGDCELETFEWFVANDGGRKDGQMEIPAGHQFLKPLDKELPALKRPEWQARPPRR